MCQIAVALPRDVDQVAHDRGALAVGLVHPVVADPVGLAWADQIVAVIIIDKKEPLAAIDHRGQDLLDLLLGGFVVGGGVAIDKIEPVARLGDIVAQLGLLGADKLVFQRLNFPIRQRARLHRHQNGNDRHGQNQRQGRDQRQLLRIAKGETGPKTLHGDSISGLASKS